MPFFEPISYGFFFNAERHPDAASQDSCLVLISMHPVLRNKSDDAKFRHTGVIQPVGRLGVGETKPVLRCFAYDRRPMTQSRSLAMVRTLMRIAGDLLSLVPAAVRSHAQLAAENLFLRKQLALYVERQVKPHRADDATRIALVTLSRLIEWRHLLIVVKPETLIRWHRKGFQLFWRWKSRPRGRPRLPADLQRLIGDMATANRTWGEERIASELLLKLGIRVSPRTVRRYMPTGGAPRSGERSQLWSTFVRNHASAILACDFFVSVTATFRLVYVFVVLDVGTRRILHWNATDHPTAEWTAQQFRMVVSGDEPHRLVIHDHDSIYSESVDRTITAMGLTSRQDSRSVTAGERVLRACDRHDPA